MLGRQNLKLTVMAGAVGLLTTPAAAQTAAQPANQGALPQVEVVQKKKSSPAPVAKKGAPAQASSPAPQPAPEGDFAEAGPGGATRGADGRPAGNSPSLSPVSPSTGLLPSNLQDFAGAASRVTSEQLEEQRPLTNHEALARVPGIVTVTDDGLGHHAGIGIRGSNFRRSRKVLVMEDGASINFSSYLDPSTHYTPPTDRLENIEVLRGTVVAYGPLNNHGVINFQNLNPFGTPGTVIKGVLSYTDDSNKEIGNYRHVRTRQNLGNVGVVASYSGSEAPGSWEIERLRYNDFYGALGFRGSQQDLTISGSYNRQRDNYDEDNFVGTAADFFANGHAKPSALFDEEGLQFNTYNAEHYNLQLAHNYYVTDDTTISTRIYGHNHDRRRFSSREDGPAEGGWMRGREREYEVFGAESRIEFANVPIAASIRQDIQAGVRYERHKLTNCTSFGRVGEVLDGSNSGNCRSEEGVDGYEDDGEIFEYKADSFAAFIQSAIHLSPSLTVTPGLRFESYDVTGREVFPGTESAKSDHDHVLPGIAFAWEALNRTTLYGGYHQGFAPHIVRDVDLDGFPLDEEVGDNFQIGVRSTAIKGFTFDVAYFHSIIDDYQLKEAYSNAAGDGLYGTLDEVEIKGVELAARMESAPFTGGPWNFFGEATYTYTDGKIKRGSDSIFDFENFTAVDQDVSGKRLPFTIEHFANLTVGVAYRKLWDASVTATYRGDFFTNAQNTSPLLCVDEEAATEAEGDGVFTGCYGGDEMVGGKVDDVWLLSARSNFNLTDKLTLFVAGTNLTDELYIADLSDGAKPGQGRTIYGGFTLKFD
ncbi:TonB-dependent receptor family protein [Hyphomicrobium zavarzinii]|uniref:TonB-dependent receptor family protein n=1 Tax=Hyphomicrobium zavarzinii TaxID=48292 RepID=UPI000367F691|nr:TonB-dependent receptor [Hyphomicrobium zavarzinii]